MNQSSEQVRQITPAFLNSVLPPAIADQATVIDIRHEQLTGNRSFNADLWRLHLTYDRPFPTAPRSLIAKLPTVNAELHERAMVFQPGLKENWFYSHGAARSPVHVPHCYHQAIDRSTGQSILLLEDLAPALPGNQLEGVTLPQAKLALASLARLHASWWADAASSEARELARLLSDSGAGEHNLVQELYDAAWPQFVRQNTVPDKVRRFGTALVGNMNVIDELLDQAPKTLVHGDYRLENMLFESRGGKPICWVTDWEDVFFGSGMVDVSWFLGGCLPVEKSKHETGLLRHYHQTLIDEGVEDYSWTRCYYDYRYAMCSSFVQGVLSATTLEESATEYGRKLANVVGRRFTQGVQRLRLLELLSQT